MELIEKISMLFISLLLGVLLLTGCSKSEEPGTGDDAGNTTAVTGTDSGNTGTENVDPTGITGITGITATPMPTATPEPTPTPPFVKTAYETVGRDDIYRIPLTEIDNEKGYFMSNKYAGDYTLFWIDVPEKIDDTAADDVSGDIEDSKADNVPTDIEDSEANDVSADTENTEGDDAVTDTDVQDFEDTPEYSDIPGSADIPDYRSEYTDRNILVLMQPTVSSVQYRYEFDFMINEPFLLDDGTVIIEEMEGRTVHVLNDELKEVQSFTPDEDYSAVLGVDSDGYIWFSCEKDHKLIATDFKGKKLNEHDYDPQYQINGYHGTYDGQKCFWAVDDEDYLKTAYLYLAGDDDKAGDTTNDGNEITYITDGNTELGYEWKGYNPPSYDSLDLISSRSTWFFHVPGNVTEGYAFPKSSLSEGVSFMKGNVLCGGSEFCVDRETYKYRHEYRLYDMDARTVSGVLREEDIPGCEYLSPLGTLDDGYVILKTDNEDGSRGIILWSAGNDTSPIQGFCDFTKDDPAECLTSLLSVAKDDYGIVITPDRTEHDGTAASVGDFMAEMEFANNFILTAQADPEVVKPKKGELLHPENKSNNDGAQYTFNPHVFSGFYLKEHGEERRDAFFRYVDALRAGEDEYECPNEGCAAWSGGRLAKYFFPLGFIYTSVEYVGNGRAKITYNIPKEEFLAKEKDFEERIVEILNDVLEEDYTDFEKALALYEFMTEYTVYDYDMLEHSVEWMDRQSGYRVLMEHQGICWEIACLYRYLLLQCGVDAEESTGLPVKEDEDMHEWNYLALDGKGYLIDATWGLTENREPNMEYFLFTDDMRERRDGYIIDSFDIGGYGLYGTRKVYSFEANDERYSELWYGTFLAFDEEEKCIFYRNIFGEICRFDY